MNHVTSKPRKKLLKRLNTSNDNILLTIVDSLVTFILIMFSWIFFRADNVGHALTYVFGIFSSSILIIPHFQGMKAALITILLIMIFFIIEWIGRKREYAIAGIGSKWPIPVRWAMYYGIILTIIWFFGEEQQFIYFQF